MRKILIKRLSKNINLPKKTDGSSGMDLSANIENSISIKPGKSIIPTGISVHT